VNQRGYCSIGEVVDLLSGEFPDITISKVRFLESRALLAPERAPSGYRRYRDDDIGQLRWVLRQQRDHFLPLRVIRQQLASGAFQVGQPDESHAPVPRVDATRPPDTSIELTGKEVTQRSGLSLGQLTELEKFGLVQPAQRRGRAVYSADDLVAAQLVYRLLAHGFEPRHLRPFRAAAEREASLIEQRLVGVDGEVADHVRAELVHLGAELRALLLRRLIH
jgi:DNA-binding transcriptional MerR regulator